MKQRLIQTIATLVFLFLALKIGVTPISAQQPTPTPGAPIPTPTLDIERRISDIERKMHQLEVEQTQTIESLQSSINFSGILITVFSVIVGAMVALQGYSYIRQVRREEARDHRQARREDERDLAELAGVEQVSKIMTVVQQTLEGRRVAEERAREEAGEARKQLDEVRNEVEILDRFFKRFQANILNERQAIEEIASRWAREVARHEFRQKASDLNDFARRFDRFKTDSEPLEEEARLFSARVPCIRGIAALIANQPEIAKRHLTQVVGFQQPESDETEIAYYRRVANAYYYLGVNESNFGTYPDAIAYFEKANALDPQGTDFLTRVVTAEAYAMKGDLDMAMQFLNEVEQEASKKELTEERLRNVYRRLRSRATLIKANLVIRRREVNQLEKAKELLEPVYESDPNYYYATATLAQVLRVLGDTSRAQELFSEANQTIERSGDLIIVTEVRSRILLLMFAGMCCKHSPMDEKRSEDHLVNAESLLGSLPKMDSQVCMVFSPFSKQNENSATIRDQIGSIRNGDVLEPVKSD